MKLFLIKISLFIGIIVAILVLSLYFSKDNESHYLYAHHNKMVMLDTIPGPRIILVGGSNVAFGFDSEMIEDSLKTKVINTGLHASIGLRLMMDEVLKRADDNDTIVVLPELEQFYTHYNGKDTRVTDAVLYSTESTLNALNLEQWYNFIGGIPKHVEENLRFKTGREYVYAATNFNSHGDEIAHWKEKRSTLPNKSYTINQSINRTAVSDFADKIKSFEARGGTVILLWPSTITKNLEDNKKALEEISVCLGRNGIMFNDGASYFAHPDSMAFDTYYHMSYPAVEENSERFIDLWKRIRNSD